MFVSLNISTTEKQSKSQHASRRRLEKGSGMEKRYSTSYRLLFDWGRETNWLSCSHAFEMRITQTTWLFKAENFFPPNFPNAPEKMFRSFYVFLFSSSTFFFRGKKTPAGDSAFVTLVTRRNASSSCAHIERDIIVWHLHLKWETHKIRGILLLLPHPSRVI
jgi:hypothetical protein